MLSRVANAVYWMSRYVERAENVARFVEVNQHLMLDQPGDDDGQWAPLVSITGDNAWFSEHYAGPTREAVVRFLTLDADYAHSIFTCLRAARENARSVREIISSEMWEHLNKAYHMVQNAKRAPEPHLEDPTEFLQKVKEACHVFIGTTYVTMTHNEAWHFMKLGRLMERADKTSRIVDVKFFLLLPHPTDVGTPVDELQWGALLKSASAFEMYRKRFGRITPEPVIDFLLLDNHFPRAIRRCVHVAEDSVIAITGGRRGTWTNAAERRIGRLRAELEYAEVSEIIAQGLHEWVDSFQTKLNQVGNAVSETFFE